MNILLVGILFSFLTPAPAVKTNVVFRSSEVTETSENDKKEERADTTLENALLGTGVGLVAVGGIGAGVVAHNNAKPKNVPSKQIDATYDEEEEKKRLGK